MPAKWNVFTNNFDLVSDLDSVVVGPGVSTDNAICRFDGTTGKLIQNSGSTLSDSDLLSTGELNLTTQLAEIYGGTNQITYQSGDILYASSTDTLSKLPKGADAEVLTLAAGLPTWAAASGGGSMPPFEFGGISPSFDLNTTTGFAPLNYRDFGSLERLVRSFDSTTTEYCQGEFRCPDDIDTSGTVTFEISGSASTAAASKNVKFSFDFIEVGDGDALTGSYGTAEVWDDMATDSTQDNMDIFSNTETVANLGFTAGKRYFWRLYRSTATTNNLATDYDVIDFIGLIPRA